MTALPDRSCGTCTLCCRLPDIDELDKPANDWCRRCLPGRGCAAYTSRPQLCRDFLCAWMTDASYGPEWTPTQANMMVYAQGPQITVLVDPAFPDAWRNEPHASRLRQIAADAEADGGYVIVFVGDDVFKVEPEHRKETSCREHYAATA